MNVGLFVAKVMSVDIYTSLTSTYSTLAKEDVHRLFITENGLLVGVISAMDILKKIV